MKKIYCKYGFSLTELLASITIMAILSLLVVSAVAKKTKKTFEAPKSAKLICYKDINGVLHQRSEIKNRDGGAPRIEDKIVSSCSFNVAADARNAVLYVIGGGGGGASLNNAITSETDELSIPLNLGGDSIRDMQQIQRNKITGVGYDLYVQTLYCDKVTTNGSSYSVSNWYGKIVNPGYSLNRETNICNDSAAPLAIFEAGNVYSIEEVLSKICSCSEDAAFTVGQTMEFSGNKNNFTKYFDENYTKSILQQGAYGNISSNANDKCIGHIEDVLTPNGQTYFSMIRSNVLDTRMYKLRAESPKFEKKFACYNGGIVNLDDVPEFRDIVVTGKSVINADVKTIKSIRIFYGNGGANGEVKKYSIGSSYAGKTIRISADDIGVGGGLDHDGGATKLNPDFETYQGNVSSGGTKGVVQNKTFDASKLISTINASEKLGNDGNLKNSIAFVDDFVDRRANEGVSDYYFNGGNAGGIVNLNSLALPNSVCVSDPAASSGYKITKYNSDYEDSYNLNYGGGGGGYVPCVKYGKIQEAKLKYYKNETESNVEVGYTGDVTPVYIETNSYKPTKGMGGAIILQWGE